MVTIHNNIQWNKYNLTTFDNNTFFHKCVIKYSLIKYHYIIWYGVELYLWKVGTNSLVPSYVL